MAKKKLPKQPVPNSYSFDSLMKETAKQAGLLAEFFRLNLLYYQLISGRGLEFYDMKRYVPGDDVRRLDWKVFARTNKLYTRIFKEERVFDIIIILDVSNSMLLGTQQMTKNEFGSLVAGTLAYAAVEAGDQVGGGTFSKGNPNLTEADGDYVQLINRLTDSSKLGGIKDWDGLSDELLANYKDDSIIFIISDFIDTHPERYLPELAGQFTKIFGIMVRDPLDSALPKGVGKMYLKDPHTSRVILSDVDKVRKEYEVMAKAQEKYIKDTFQQYGQVCFKITTGEEFGTAFIKAFGGETVEIY